METAGVFSNGIERHQSWWGRERYDRERKNKRKRKYCGSSREEKVGVQNLGILEQEEGKKKYMNFPD